MVSEGMVTGFLGYAAVVAFFVVVNLVAVFAAEIAQLLPWVQIGFANLCAGIVAGGYLWWAHSRLLAELHASSDAGSSEGDGTFPPPVD